MAQATAQAHGGRIVAGQSPEGGALFQLFLPAANEADGAGG